MTLGDFKALHPHFIEKHGLEWKREGPESILGVRYKFVCKVNCGITDCFRTIDVMSTWEDPTVEDHLQDAIADEYARSWNHRWQFAPPHLYQGHNGWVLDVYTIPDLTKPDQLQSHRAVTCYDKSARDAFKQQFIPSVSSSEN